MAFKRHFVLTTGDADINPIQAEKISKTNIIELLKNALTHQIDSIKTENLYEFDGKAAYSLGQGQ